VDRILQGRKAFARKEGVGGYPANNFITKAGMADGVWGTVSTWVWLEEKSWLWVRITYRAHFPATGCPGKQNQQVSH
jgi:hypothetical protein